VSGKPLNPSAHQVDQLAALTATFAVHDRAQLISACGTGKTGGRTQHPASPAYGSLAARRWTGLPNRYGRSWEIAPDAVARASAGISVILGMRLGRGAATPLS
jgi:hypothetical protein